MRGQVGADEVLICGSAERTANEGSDDGHPPIVLRRGEGGTSPSGDKAEGPWAEVAGGIDGPGFEVDLPAAPAWI